MILQSLNSCQSCESDDMSHYFNIGKHMTWYLNMEEYGTFYLSLIHDDCSKGTFGLAYQDYSINFHCQTEY